MTVFVVQVLAFVGSFPNLAFFKNSIKNNAMSNACSVERYVSLINYELLGMVLVE